MCSASFEDFLVFDTEIQKVELRKPKTRSYFLLNVQTLFALPLIALLREKS